MNDIEKAEKIVRDLEETLESLLGRTKVLEVQRRQISYAAHTGDQKARTKLNQINAEAATHGGEIESVNAALAEAQARLAAVHRAEALAADKAAALQLRAKAARFKELGEVLDDCFADFKSAAIEMKTVLDDIHRLGCASPTHELFKANGDRAFKTAVMGTPFWTQDFPFLAPGERKSFRSLVAAWTSAIENNVALRLGEKQKEAA
jgi:hypothetical protein